MLELLFAAAMVLSPGVDRAYGEFLARPDMAFFAVSADGRAWGRSYCPEGEVCTAGRLREIAIGHCLVHGDGCVVHASKPWR